MKLFENSQKASRAARTRVFEGPGLDFAFSSLSTFTKGVKLHAISTTFLYSSLLLYFLSITNPLIVFSRYSLSFSAGVLNLFSPVYPLPAS